MEDWQERCGACCVEVWKYTGVLGESGVPWVCVGFLFFLSILHRSVEVTYE